MATLNVEGRCIRRTLSAAERMNAVEPVDARSAAERAERWRHTAAEARSRGDRDAELDALSHAAACCAAPPGPREPVDEALSAGEQHAPAIPVVLNAALQAAVCHRLADLLREMGRLPQAMQAYQQAADAYAAMPRSVETSAGAAECAHRIRDGVKALRSRPADRLYLLVSKYERELARLAEMPGTEADQGETALHIAGIFHRCERFEEAVGRYQQAAELFRAAPGSGEHEAVCHHRLGDIYDHELGDAVRAFSHYRQAIRLYAEFEPATDGRQISRLLCERRLRDLSTNLAEFIDNRQ